MKRSWNSIYQRPRPWTAAFIAAAAFAAGAPSAQAQDYDIAVMAIRATKSSDKIDPQLTSLARDLRKQFKYTGFDLLKRESKRAAQGKTVEVDLPGNFIAKVTPRGRQGNRVEMQIEVVRKVERREQRLVRSVVIITAGQFSLHGGWELPGGGEDVLIVAVGAR